jgi:hypothetical protein
MLIKKFYIVEWDAKETNQFEILEIQYILYTI